MSPAGPSTQLSSRDRVLAALRESPTPLGVAALIAATGLSANAVRFHLQHLIERGTVQAATDPDHTGPGRPALRYGPTLVDGADPASAYQLLAALLARAVSRSATPGSASEAGKDWARTIVPPGLSDTDRDPVDVVRGLFASSGFEPTTSADGTTLELHHCPFLELAVQQPDVVCGMHLGLVTGLLEQLGAHRTVRLVPVLDGSAPCLVRMTESRPTRASRKRTTTDHHLTLEHPP